MHEKKIKAELCGDHFERLVASDVCATCPSRFENEQVVVAMSKVLEAEDTEAVDRAVVTELRSIRRLITDLEGRIDDRLSSLETRVIGSNGESGIATRLTVLETQQDTNSKNTTANVALIGTVVATVLGIISLLN